MIKLLWNFGADFLSKDSREKLIIFFSFIIALCILFYLGEKGLQLVGVIVGGWFTFLKGFSTNKEEEPIDTNYLTNLSKERDKLQMAMVSDPKKEQVYEGE